MSKINRREFSRLVLAGAGATLLPASELVARVAAPASTSRLNSRRIIFSIDQVPTLSLEAIIFQLPACFQLRSGASQSAPCPVLQTKSPTLIMERNSDLPWFSGRDMLLLPKWNRFRDSSTSDRLRGKAERGCQAP